MTNRKYTFVVAGGLALLALFAALWVVMIIPKMNRTAADSLGMGDYALLTTDRTQFTEDSLKGAPSAVFFGFTHCPEVCPTTLGDIAGWQAELSDQGKELRTYFVTVDPERDTIDMMQEYVSWVPGVVGVSGPEEEVKKAITSFRVYAQKVPLKNGGYTMDHSAFVMLFDKKGRFVQTISYGEQFDSAMKKIDALH
ncbi:protein SCO1/2 [Thalassococcus halodurans]|uniref:Protein SCO1/2 n=1 Tax=Thalassococcus halodurans TaxID=373675 RepID=A0A1H5SBZ1_9RHOB|nr:SCO family protein [Thalassococcus halodurans]SEF48045.1 protein SCO1/2 [Thalassococcus halodurans]